MRECPNCGGELIPDEDVYGNVIYRCLDCTTIVTKE